MIRHEISHHHQAIPCKQRPPTPIGAYIPRIGPVLHSFSPLRFSVRHIRVTTSAKGSQTREKPNDTPFELLALLLLALPLLFTFRKLVAESAAGDRNHQFSARMIFSTKPHDQVNLNRRRSDSITPFISLISSAASIDHSRKTFSLTSQTSHAISSCAIKLSSRPLACKK